MAPLPINNTGWVGLLYTANGRAHSCNFRYAGSGAPDPSFLEGLDDILIAANPLMPTDWAFTAWSYTVQGGNVGVPLAGAPTPFAGQLTAQLKDVPAFISAIGRTASGRRSGFMLLGAGFDAGEGPVAQKYRIKRGANGQIDAFLNAVQASDLVGIDETLPFWKEYVNLGYQAAWQRKARK
jgi:hypothetical protein